MSIMGPGGILTGGKQPVHRPAPLPIAAQFFQQARRQQRVTIFVAFALHHLDLLTGAVDVFGLEMTGFIEPQTRPINRHQKGPMSRMGATRREEPFQLGHEGGESAGAVGAARAAAPPPSGPTHAKRSALVA
jgi:hypothetical protein